MYSTEVRDVGDYEIVLVEKRDFNLFTSFNLTVIEDPTVISNGYLYFSPHLTA